MYQPFTCIYLPSSLHAYTYLYLFIPTSTIYILLGRSPRWSSNWCSFRIESIMASNGWCANGNWFNLAQVIYPRLWSQFPIQNFMFSVNNNGLDVTCYTNRKICCTFLFKTYDVYIFKWYTTMCFKSFHVWGFWGLFGLKYKVICKVKYPNLVNDIQKVGQNWYKGNQWGTKLGFAPKLKVKWIWYWIWCP
jgi:hypothetical protein